MYTGKTVKLLTVMISLMLFLLPSLIVSADEVPRMTKEELKGLIGNPDVIVLDVRRGKDWNASEFKIKGAIRESTKDISWANKYPKDRTLVLYCA